MWYLYLQRLRWQYDMVQAKTVYASNGKDRCIKFGERLIWKVLSRGIDSNRMEFWKFDWSSKKARPHENEQKLVPVTTLMAPKDGLRYGDGDNDVW